jgi:hypothetical protein
MEWRAAGRPAPCSGAFAREVDDGRPRQQDGIATGRPFTITGVTIDRFIDGRIAESNESWDALGMLQQLGVLPETEV